jgi:hypothetical protein
MHAAAPATQLTNLTVDGAGRTCHRPCGRKLEFTDASEDLLAGKRRLDAVEDGGRRRPATSTTLSEGMMKDENTAAYAGFSSF